MTTSLQSFRATRPARILVVEDEAIVALELTERLTEAGYVVCGTADSADEAVALAREQRPDLILMDVVLKGGGDGVGAAHRIAGFATTPVVYLTSFSDSTTIQRAAATGPYGYLTKPYQHSELIAAIEVACHKSLLEQRLKASERWFSSTLRCVSDAVLTVGLDTRLRFANPAAERLLGRRAAEIVGARLDDVLDYDDDCDNCDDGGGGSGGTGAPSGRLSDAASRTTHRLRTRDGVVAVDVSVAPIRDEHAAALGWVCALRDVTDRVAAEAAVRRSEERFRAAFEFAPVGMALLAMDGTLLQTNAALRSLLALGAPEPVTAPRLSDFLLPGDEGDEAARLRALVRDRQRPFTQYERRFRAVDGRVFWGSVSASVMHGDQAPAWYLYQVLDISERKADESRLSERAYCDPLTGLANRARFAEELRRRSALCASGRCLLGVVMADLDDFKPVNDRHGHAAGDELLVQVGTRLRSVLRGSDCVARWGGDEFAILLSGLPSARDAALVADKLIAAFDAPFSLSVGEIRVGLSLGLALCPEDASTPEELLRLADAALYRCKRAGKGSFRTASDADRAIDRAAHAARHGRAPGVPLPHPATNAQGENAHE